MYIKKFLKHYYVMLVPAFLWLIFFSIVPMFGIIMAFEDYNPGLGPGLWRTEYYVRRTLT